MIAEIVWPVLFLILPAGVLLACRKIPFLDTLGAVVVCYIIGLVLGNLGIFPEKILSVQDTIATVVIPLALPLVFFSLRLQSMKNQAGAVVKSFAGAFAAIIIASIITFLVFRQFIPDELWKVSGMLIGVYTGGTPNMAAIGTALQVDSTRYIAVHGSDVIVGGVLLLLILSVLPRLFRRILPAFSSRDIIGKKEGPAGVPPHAGDNSAQPDLQIFSPYFKGFSAGNLGPLAAAAGIAVLIFAVGGGLSLLVPEGYSSLVAILTITTLSVAASTIPSVRRIRYTFQAGHYLLLVFSLVVSSMADIHKLSSTAPGMMLYIAGLLVLTMAIHTLISKLLKVDADTHLITATALIYSPPFVPVVASTLKNRDVMMGGMVTGIAGWIIGNYLGIGFGYLIYSIFY